MMALGADIMPTGGKLQGARADLADGTNTRKMFAQMHYYISPVWKMLDMFTDLPCIEDDGFDVALITEVLPTWQSATLGAIIQPEAILFGNPAAGLACMADSAAAAAGKVVDPLFWCMGSAGARPIQIAGDIHFGDSVEAWAGLAARGVFMMGRLGALTVSSADGCSLIPAAGVDQEPLQIPADGTGQGRPAASMSAVPARSGPVPSMRRARTMPSSCCSKRRSAAPGYRRREQVALRQPRESARDQPVACPSAHQPGRSHRGQTGAVSPLRLSVGRSAWPWIQTMDRRCAPPRRLSSWPR